MTGSESNENVTVNGRTFTAPGPGVWEYEAVHMPRPISPWMAASIGEASAAGFAFSAKFCGALVSHLALGVVHGFAFSKIVPVGAPEGAKGPPPKLIFQLLTRLHPEIRRRIRRSVEVFEKKLWREELKRWDDEVKPRARARQAALQSLEPSTLDDAGLTAHLEACLQASRDMIYQHHEFTVTCGLPVGDYLAHAAEWTGLTMGELLQALRGATPVSRGVAAAELDALAAAVRESPDAQALLQSNLFAGEILDALKAQDGEVGRLARAWIDLVGCRSIGYDVYDQMNLELPGLLVRALRTTLEAGTGAAAVDTVATERIRSRVPEAHRDAFDALLAEARLIFRLRDERGVFSDGWSTGLLRRAVLAVGERLGAQGKLDDAELILDTTPEEALAMLRGGAGPGSAALRERRDFRLTTRLEDVPLSLGGTPSGPPPAEWLPAKGRRAAKAVDAFIGCVFGTPGHVAPAAAPSVGQALAGTPVSPGTVTGRICLVSGPSEFASIERGDILVTASTSPYFNVVLPMLGGIVTDRGGQLSHAAIVAREYGIPCIVDTRVATRTLKTGQRARLDGTTGSLTVLT